MDRQRLERGLAQLPILQYAFWDTAELRFSERVRHICETECPMYGKSWSCPPGVGSVAQCRARCLSYPETLVLVTAAEVRDAADMAETLETRGAHESVTRQAEALLRAEGAETYTLSAESCARCRECTCPDAPCRFPDELYPCVESHAVVVTDIAEKLGVDFLGSGVVTWFSLLFFRET